MSASSFNFKHTLACLAALSGAWLFLFLLVNPLGDFPLNDDFVFAESARHLATSGELRISQWSLPANIPHIALGAVLSLIAEPSNNNLRLLMLALGGAAVLVFFLFLRDLGISRGKALAGTAFLAANPIYMTMSASFHADITSLALQVFALWSFVRGLRSRAIPWFILCSSLIGLTGLNRQSAVIAVLGPVGFLLREGRLSLKTTAAILLPASLMAAAYWGWFCFIHGLTWAWQAARHTPALDPRALMDPSVWVFSALRVNGIAQTLGLFLFPLSLGVLPLLKRQTRPTRAKIGLLIVVATVALAGVLLEGGMPYLQNTLHRRGLGVPTLSNPEMKYAGLWSEPLLWRGIEALSLASVIILALFAFSPSPRFKNGEARALLWLTLPPFLVLLALPVYYDRYLLTLMPGLIAVLLLRLGDRRLSAACLYGCLSLAAVSTIGLADYFAWNRARWEAGLYGISLGIPPQRIENGFDWDGQFSLERNMRKLLSERPAREIGVWDWMAVDRMLLATSFSETPPRNNFVFVKKFPYSTPLGRNPRFVFLYGYR